MIKNEIPLLNLYYLGISSNVKDILLISKINAKSTFNFFYDINFKYKNKLTENIEEYTLFKNDIFTQAQKALILNTKNTETNLFPKIKQMDYLLITTFENTSIKNIINNLECVQHTFTLDAKILSDKAKLLYTFFETE